MKFLDNLEFIILELYTSFSHDVNGFNREGLGEIFPNQFDYWFRCHIITSINCNQQFTQKFEIFSDFYSKITIYVSSNPVNSHNKGAF